MANGIPNHLTGGLPNDYREVNGYSTEAAYQDGRREVDQEVYHEVDRQSLPSRPRFTETPALLESVSARRLSSGRRIRGRRWQQKIIGKDHGRSEKSTKISTELPTELPTKKQSTKFPTKKKKKKQSTKLPSEKQSTELPTEKQSTEMSTKKSTGRSPTLIPNHITEKRLLANANDYGGIQRSMRLHCTRAWKSTTVLQYMVSITTY